MAKIFFFQLNLGWIQVITKVKESNLNTTGVKPCPTQISTPNPT
jgi:hypothetical protein